MIFTKKIYLVFVILFALHSKGLSQEKSSGWTLYLQPAFSCTIGKMNESIYSSKGYKCSLLEWEQKPLWNYGITVFTAFKNFGITAEFDSALPVSCGKMYDSDWNSNGIKTTYSIHELTAETNLNTEFSLSYIIKLDRIFQIIPFVQAQYSYNSFEARNGEGWYGGAAYSKTGKDVSWNDENAAYYKVYGIDYLRHSFYLFTGFSFQLYITEKIKTELLLSVSPFTYTSAIDHHHGKYNDFRFQEIQYGYFSRFKTGIKLEYSINSLIDAGMFFQAVLGTEDKGKLYSDYWTEKLTLVDNQKSGADIQSYRLSLFVTIKVLK